MKPWRIYKGYVGKYVSLKENCVTYRYLLIYPLHNFKIS